MAAAMGKPKPFRVDRLVRIGALAVVASFLGCRSNHASLTQVASGSSIELPELSSKQGEWLQIISSYPINGLPDQKLSMVSEEYLKQLQDTLRSLLTEYASLRQNNESAPESETTLESKSRRDRLACSGARILTTLEDLLNHSFDGQLLNVPPSPISASDLMVLEKRRELPAQIIRSYGLDSPQADTSIRTYIHLLQISLGQFSKTSWILDRPALEDLQRKRLQVAGGQCNDCASCPPLS